MLQKTLGGILLAPLTIFLLYLAGYKGDYPSLSYSIVILLCSLASVVAAAILMIAYGTSKDYFSFTTAYVTSLLSSNIVAIILMGFPGDFRELLFSEFGLLLLLMLSLIFAMLFGMIIPNLRRSGTGKG